MDFRYYVIKSKSNGQALDVRGASCCPNTEVIPYSQHNKNNQIWYQDPARGIIVTKMNTGFCIDVEDGRVVINPFKPGDENQQWEFHESKLKNRFNHDKVIELHEGALRVGEKDKDSSDQLWEFEECGNSSDISKPPLFYIVSELNGKVIDIDKGSNEEDAKIEMWNRHPDRLLNQLWYVDYYGNVRSALNNMVFKNKGYGKKLKMAPYKNTPRHQWKIDGCKLVNGDGECMDIMGQNGEDGAKVCSYEFKDTANQRWKIQYE